MKSCFLCDVGDLKAPRLYNTFFNVRNDTLCTWNTAAGITAVSVSYKLVRALAVFFFWGGEGLRVSHSFRGKTGQICVE